MNQSYLSPACYLLNPCSSSCFIIRSLYLFMKCGRNKPEEAPFSLEDLGGVSKCLSGKESTCQYRRCRRHGFHSWVRKAPWRRKWQPTPVFFPGQSHGQKNLVGCSPRGSQKSWTWLRMYSRERKIRIDTVAKETTLNQWRMLKKGTCLLRHLGEKRPKK